MRGAVVGDSGERQADELLGEGLRVGDGGRREHELGCGAIRCAEAPQTADHLRRVGAEHAAVDVRLVEDHEAQMVQELGPAFVAGEDADVEHVRVAEQDGGAAADLGALRLRRVAVVDGRHGARQAQRAQLARLVLGQRLGRIEVQGARGRVLGAGVDGRKRETERLAARRAGGHDHVVAGLQQLVSAALVAVEAFHALGRQRRAHPGVELVRQWLETCWASGLVRDVDDLVVGAVQEEGSQRCLGGEVVAGGGHVLILPDEPGDLT